MNVRDRLLHELNVCAAARECVSRRSALCQLIVTCVCELTARCVIVRMRRQSDDKRLTER